MSDTPENPKASQRRFRRLDFVASAIVFYKDQTFFSETLQVSEGGVLLQTPADVVENEAITIHFVIDKRYVRAKGIILYVLHDPVDNLNRVGVRFDSISEMDREVISRFVIKDQEK